MTLKQQALQMVDDLPEDSPVLAEVIETVRLNQSIGEAMADVAVGWTMEAEDFVKRVGENWPHGFIHRVAGGL